jgi:ribosomal protein L9
LIHNTLLKGYRICGVALEMKRNSASGNIFGGVNPKMIMDALKEQYPKGSLDGRQVKLTDMKDSEGKDVTKKDIKYLLGER